MREIKFKYVLGVKQTQEIKAIVHISIEEIEQGKLLKYLQEYDVLYRLQSTGLKDKKGVEIYNGDLIFYAGNGDKKEYAEVVFECEETFTSGFYLKYDECYYVFHSEDDEPYIWYEVVGNIYQNKELLNETKN